MKVYANHFGHPIEYNREEHGWYYLDGVKCTRENYQESICPRCNLSPTKEGHDPCIANLKGVAFACCGHGVKKEEGADPYICFEGKEKRVIRFNSTEEILNYVKDNRLISKI